MIEAMLRGQRSGLQFSGGKDSLAVLHHLREHLDKIVVYCIHPEEVFPETQESIDYAKTLAPHFVELIAHRPPGTIPSDVVTCQNTPFGRMLTRSAEPALIDRYTCCYETLMRPMYQRMLDDKVTQVIRGQKRTDPMFSPVRSGDIVLNVRYWFPIEDWTSEEVLQYLRANDVPIPASYSMLQGGLDCPGCTAWVDEDKMSYLSRAHPGRAAQLQADLKKIWLMVQPSIDALRLEANIGSH